MRSCQMFWGGLRPDMPDATSMGRWPSSKAPRFPWPQRERDEIPKPGHGPCKSLSSGPVPRTWACRGEGINAAFTVAWVQQWIPFWMDFHHPQHPFALIFDPISDCRHTIDRRSGQIFNGFTASEDAGPTCSQHPRKATLPKRIWD